MKAIVIVCLLVAVLFVNAEPQDRRYPNHRRQDPYSEDTETESKDKESSSESSESEEGGLTVDKATGGRKIRSTVPTRPTPRTKVIYVAAPPPYFGVNATDYYQRYAQAVAQAHAQPTYKSYRYPARYRVYEARQVVDDGSYFEKKETVTQRPTTTTTTQAPVTTQKVFDWDRQTYPHWWWYYTTTARPERLTAQEAAHLREYERRRREREEELQRRRTEEEKRREEHRRRLEDHQRQVAEHQAYTSYVQAYYNQNSQRPYYFDPYAYYRRYGVWPN